MKPLTATLFAIKRYAIHDGPNIRTTLFFKGCPLSCIWCHNPEGIPFKSEIISVNEKCIGCGDCIENCPQKALSANEKELLRDSGLCNDCGICVDCCPALAHEATGYKLTIDELMQEIEKDLPFFNQSGGGVTFSGGEPLSQPEILLALLDECGHRSIHRVVDTSGYAPAETLLAVAEKCELMLFDLKQMDSIIHSRLTGVPNDLILSNLELLAKKMVPVRIRIPLIKGINDQPENLVAAGNFIKQWRNIEGVDLLPYHPSAKAKYKKLKLDYQDNSLSTPDPQTVNEAILLLKNYVPDVKVGG